MPSLPVSPHVVTRVADVAVAVALVALPSACG